MKKTRKSLQASTGSKQVSFLPEPDFNPRMPSKNTLSFRALLMMLSGRKISHPDFEGKTDSWRLAAHIHILVKLGWPVDVVDVGYSATKRPHKRHIRKYFLPTNVISKIRTLGGWL